MNTGPLFTTDNIFSHRIDLLVVCLTSTGSSGDEIEARPCKGLASHSDVLPRMCSTVSNLSVLILTGMADSYNSDDANKTKCSKLLSLESPFFSVLSALRLNVSKSHFLRLLNHPYHLLPVISVDFLRSFHGFLGTVN